jgi:predicted SAM-dependent methyltransferase
MINLLKKIYRSYLNKKKKLFFEQALRKNPSPLKIVIGSSGVFENNWIPSEEFFLNLLQPSTWSVYFKPSTIDMLVAEHVWEHLTPEQGKVAAQTCYTFLKPGGHLRVAVPDGFHSSQEYIDYVKPGGSGYGSDDHKVLYNYKTFSEIFASAGFTIKLLEYFDENGTFHAHDWNSPDGHIRRSKRFDKRNSNGGLNYTSLIIDAVK